MGQDQVQKFGMLVHCIQQLNGAIISEQSATQLLVGVCMYWTRSTEIYNDLRIVIQFGDKAKWEGPKNNWSRILDRPSIFNK